MNESDRRDPIAWAVIEHGDPWPLALFTSHADAELYASRKNDIGQRNCEAVPLYRQPALANAEREAIERASRNGWACDGVTLRMLLERLA
jgi:hypothetical protein